MEAVRTREADILEAWKVREEQIRKEAGRQSRKDEMGEWRDGGTGS